MVHSQRGARMRGCLFTRPDPDVRRGVDLLHDLVEHPGAGGPAVDMGVDGHVEEDRFGFSGQRRRHRILELLKHGAGVVAVTDRAWQVVDVHGQRDRHDVARAVSLKVGQVVVVAVAVMMIASFSQQARMNRAAGAARADPPGRCRAGQIGDQSGGAADIFALAGLVEIDRDHVHAVGVGNDLVAAVMNGAHGLRPFLGQHAVGHHAGLDVVAAGDLQRAPDAAGWPVESPRCGIGIEEAGLQGISHWADARGLSLGPAFIGDVEDDADTGAVRPAKRVVEPLDGGFG